jgi:formiminotetrahydrofolate cyclodeaminase
MAVAGAYGALYNVLINLPGISDADWREEVLQRAEAAIARAEEMGHKVREGVLAKLHLALEPEEA